MVMQILIICWLNIDSVQDFNCCTHLKLLVVMLCSNELSCSTDCHKFSVYCLCIQFFLSEFYLFNFRILKEYWEIFFSYPNSGLRMGFLGMPS